LLSNREMLIEGTGGCSGKGGRDIKNGWIDKVMGGEEITVSEIQACRQRTQDGGTDTEMFQKQDKGETKNGWGADSFKISPGVTGRIISSRKRPAIQRGAHGLYLSQNKFKPVREKGT